MNRFSALFLALASSLAFSQIRYQVEVPAKDSKTLNVMITVPVSGSNTTLATTNWAPGSYVLSDTFKRLTNIKIMDPSGKVLAFSQPEPYLWQVTTAGLSHIIVSYNTPFNSDNEIGHFSGPSTYMYVWGRKNEPCTLDFNIPSDWKIATGLDETKKRSFVAGTYDVLADNPVTLGKYLEDHYTVRGKDHTIVLYGAAKSAVDRKKLVETCKKITTSEGEFFGGLPYNKYVWHFSVFNAPDGAGGLEHLSSTEISLASGLGSGTVGVLSHEFFHLWNVKRIRSFALGPFDYTKLPKTGALWWLEGVTDYYSHLILARNGMWSRERFYDSLIENVRNTSSNAAYKEVGPQRASYFVGWANNGRGNSNGYKISYYDLGWLAGFALDIKLRNVTKGKYSLDDVELALWNMCKDDQKGFAEGEIRRQLVAFGGEEMGSYYDEMIVGAGLPQLDSTLALAGISLKEVEESVKAYTFQIRPAGDGKSLMIRRSSFPLAKPFDAIVSLNGKPLGDVNATDALKMINEAQAAGPCTIEVRRGSEVVTLNLGPISERKVRRMKAIEDSSNLDAVKLRNALFKAPAPR